MHWIARIGAVAFMNIGVLVLPAGAWAQEAMFEVEHGTAKLLRLNEDGGFVVRANGSGEIPAFGADTRLMWYASAGALRAGVVDGAQWDVGAVGLASVAFGTNTTASGNYSTALGFGSIAGGEAATALGTGSEASGNSSLAAGRRARATGGGAVALGEGTTAAATDATATGYLTTASGIAATAMGHSSTASGYASTALGHGTVAGADWATAMGQGTIASGHNSTAMGYETRANGISSTAMGAASVANGIGAVAMGTRAIAEGAGSFVFADRSSTATYTGLENQFVVRAHGGIGFNSGTGIGCDLPAGVGAWACTSSRLAKENFADMDGEAVLARLADMPIQRWSYLGTRAEHVGPVAEDFYGAFGLGEGSTTITTVDADGIALLGVQTLERRTTELRAENAELLRRIENLEAALRMHASPND